ncbi:hypothetical protein [Dyadobacter pollutisoli]|uniref:Uncharacterized protein n=1 Tax=Dyadobacter pollutisoli TaxID=2910158 RepID=A0A9E8NEX8_9BACT|nr:hypothetical protein [Dyadobacter pollutisoli]WAC14708.1 hypothetical protein ON006_12250 [Dyadobacter pollutisoli]
MKNSIVLLIAFWLSIGYATAQDSARYQLRLSVPIIDLPQNKDLPYSYPSMNQALEFSADLYELSYLGIDKLGNALFKPRKKEYTRGRKILNGAFKYLASLGFVKYGSELPIPLGVWAHEEFHRAVLGVNDIDSKNGNWFPHRWDGTVYGVGDQDLSILKSKDPSQLLYSYVAGVQSEILLNRKISVQDFYKKRTLAKNALILYNAWYVWDYFKFSASSQSDSVKVWVSKNENPDPKERDFAGADLTAWAYDMFSPEKPYTDRDKFPNGEGVNRRIGYSELSEEAQKYLLNQKKLSLLNFVNPAIFFINRIPLGKHSSFNFFLQYAPTHFGNNLALMLPVQYRNTDFLIGLHRFSNFKSQGYGLDLGLYNRQLSKRLKTDVVLHFWDQPTSFYKDKKITGGSFQIDGRYRVAGNVSISLSVVGKTKGWEMGSPYLKSNVSSRLGLAYALK